MLKLWVGTMCAAYGPPSLISFPVSVCCKKYTQALLCCCLAKLSACPLFLPLILKVSDTFIFFLIFFCHFSSVTFLFRRLFLLLHLPLPAYPSSFLPHIPSFRRNPVLSNSFVVTVGHLLRWNEAAKPICEKDSSTSMFSFWFSCLFFSAVSFSEVGAQCFSSFHVSEYSMMK